MIAPLVLLVSLLGLLEPRATSDEQRRLRLRSRIGTVVLDRRRRSRPCSRCATRRSASTSASSASSSSPTGPRASRSPSSASTASPATTCASTLARAPAGYVPEEIAARPEKTWQQGLAADFDIARLGPARQVRLRDHHHAPPTTRPRRPTSSRSQRAGDYVLWQRQGDTPRSQACSPHEGGSARRDLPLPATAGPRQPGRRRRGPRRAGGRPLHRLAPAAAARARRSPARSAAGRRRGRRRSRLDLPAGHGDYELSLQYHSQVPLTVLVRRRAGRRAAGLARRHVPERRRARRLLARGRGRGADGRRARGDGAGRRARAASPGTLDARRLVWLGDARRLAGDRAAGTVALADACGRYVDHYAYERKGGRLMPHFGTPDEAAVAGARRRDARARAGGGEARLRRRHRAQRHPRALAADLAPQPLRRSSRSRSASTPTPTAFPGLLAGEVTPEQFVKRHARLLVDGAFRPAASAACTGSSTATASTPPSPRFEADHATTSRRPAGACSTTCSGSGSTREGEENPRGEALVEQSTDNVAAAPHPGRGCSRRRGSSTSSATAATPRPRASPRPAASSARAPGCRGSSGGRSGSAAIERGRGRDRATAAC